ncbi:GH36-type glycosyl hydrolase domain-containing protein [Anaerocolumna sp.]|uniref:GH36-type glycosyl hydrolase domain-containing protein n=1 Tax=Anaerocolumna sp. TaxID=2041569 RepID=UPI0028B0E57D|nr:cellobiose phosphorylase [Anaerocolumna sp.]
MKGYKYLDKKGTFELENPELTSYLYFPICNESGVMSSLTPTFGGDSKMGQNTFLFSPVSSEDLHNNKSSRNFWCHIKGKGIWSATGRSSKQQAELFMEYKDETRLEAGIMWQKVTRISKEFGITSEITSFVPHTKHRVELMIVKLKNSGKENLDITPTAAVPLYGRSADNIRDHRHVTSLLHRIETVDIGVILNPTLTFDERGHQKNQMVYGVFGKTSDGELPVGFYPCTEDFIGEGGSFENPKAISDGNIALVKEGFRIEGFEALGGIQFQNITLEPMEEKTYILVMGYGDSKEELMKEADSFLSQKAWETAFASMKKYWDEKLNIEFDSGKKDFDTWMYWVSFQPILRRIYGCSFLPHHDYGKGGRGWRDLWQDCLALLMMNPGGVKEMLIDNFSGVRMDGTNATIIGKNQGEFIADRNNITRVWMDHGVWPFLTTKLYIMQSGDIEILLKENYYFKDPQCMRGEEKDELWKQEEGNHVRTKEGDEYKGTILEHMLIQHLTSFYDVGEHNHIRLRGADWNDALDMAKERGESVAFTALYGENLNQMGELILSLYQKGFAEIPLAKELKILLEDDLKTYEDIRKKQEILHRYCVQCKSRISGEKLFISSLELANNLKNKGDWIKKHIQEREWITNAEGHSWYNGYYDNSGNAVEGDSPTGVRMMLTGQVFAIMSHTAVTEQVKEIISSADTYLYDPCIGGYKLNTDFKELKTDFGRMFGFAYGQKENGAVFSHMAVMYANALYQRGFAREGYKVIDALYRHCSNFEKSRIYPGVPEYIGGNGRGLYHYLTGAASWLLLTVLTEMYGVKGHYGDLKFSPKLTLEQFDSNQKAGANLVFADRRLLVLYYNPLKKEYGEYQIKSIFINDKLYSNYNSTVISEKPGYSGTLDSDGVILRKDLESLDASVEHKVLVELI